MNDKILAVQRMQDYIESYLTETVTLADLAGSARFSPWDDSKPRIQLEPIGKRGYIELRSVKKA